jgi:hypothetical protein
MGCGEIMVVESLGKHSLSLVDEDLESVNLLLVTLFLS